MATCDTVSKLSHNERRKLVVIGAPSDYCLSSTEYLVRVRIQKTEYRATLYRACFPTLRSRIPR